MKKALIFSIIITLALVALPALAAVGTGDQVQTNHDLFQGFYGTDNLGQAVAAGWMGNTSNPRPSGHGVLPSLAPGIWVCVYDNGICVDKELGSPFGEFVSGSSQGQGQPQ